MDNPFLEIMSQYSGILMMFVWFTLARVALKVVMEFTEILGIPETGGAPKLNLDKNGMPKDYTSYVWLLYKRNVEDDSPNRRAFLNEKKSNTPLGDLFFEMSYTEA